MGDRRRRLRLRPGAAAAGPAQLVQRPRRLLLRRLLRLLALARRPHRRRHHSRDRLRAVGEPRARPRVPRPAALPDGLDRRRLHRPGSAALLRLLRGDADPDLRPDRSLGRAAAGACDRDVLHLHDGRLAADARVDRRSRALAGDVLAVRPGNVLQRVALPRLPRRLRGEGADLPLPRLADRRLSRVAAGGCSDPLRRRLQGGRLRAAADRDPDLPRAGPGLPES